MTEKRSEKISAKHQKELEQLVEDITDASAERTFKRISIVAYGVLGICLVCVTALVIVASRPAKPPQILAADKQGGITPINAFDKPPSSPAILMALAQKYTRELMDFNAINYSKRVAENRSIFIGDDYHQAYERAIEKSAWFDSLMENKLSITAIPSGIPVVSNPSGSIKPGNKARFWLVKVPVELYLEGPGVRPITLKRTFTLELVHIKQHEFQAGIGVANIKADPAR